MNAVPRLHLISDFRACPFDSFIDVAVRAARGGVDAIHLRDRSLAAGPAVALVQELRDKLDNDGIDCRILVNDRADVAAYSVADGVQLPEAGLPVEVVRAWLPSPYLLGCSVHSVAAATNAANADADFLIAGHIFATGSKPDVPGRGVEFLAEIVRTVSVPVIAIGGITERNVTDVLSAGAHGVAVISAILSSNDPESAARAIRHTIDKHVGRNE